MRILKLALLGLTGLLVSGCVTMQPKTPDEFRVAIAKVGQVERFEAENSMSNIATILTSKANECLLVTIEQESCRDNLFGENCSSNFARYNPTVLVDDKKVELNLRVELANGDNIMPPVGGFYTLVADVTPVSNNTSQISFYYGNWDSFGEDIIVKSIKNWASGKPRGCPDLTKISIFNP